MAFFFFFQWKNWKFSLFNELMKDSEVLAVCSSWLSAAILFGYGLQLYHLNSRFNSKTSQLVAINWVIEKLP